MSGGYDPRWTPEQKKWLKKYLKPSIDRVWNWWGPRQQARKLAQGEKPWEQKCAMCKLVFTREETQVDHRVPTVEVEKAGFDDPGEYIKRKFVQVDELDVLCKPCHKKKTVTENQIRAKYRRLRKSKKESE